MKKFVLPGVLLLLAGVYLFLSRLPGVDLPMGSFFMLIGAGFLVVRAVTRRSGWSFAAFPLLFLGLGWCVVDLLVMAKGYIAVATLLGLSVAFFCIHICEYKRMGNWPMFPALVLMVGGLIALCLVTPDIRSFLRTYSVYLLPALLILLGAGLLVYGVVISTKKKESIPPQNGYTAWQEPASDAGAPEEAAAPQRDNAEPEEPAAETVEPETPKAE